MPHTLVSPSRIPCLTLPFVFLVYACALPPLGSFHYCSLPVQVFLVLVRTASAETCPLPPPSLFVCCCFASFDVFWVVFLRLCFVDFVWGLIFLTPLPACTHDTATLDFCCCDSSPVSFPVLSPVGLSPWRSSAMPGGRSSLVSPPLRSPLHRGLRRAPLTLLPSYSSSRASCTPLCPSPRHGCIFLAYMRCSVGARSPSR